MNRAKIFIVLTFFLAFALQVSAQAIKFPNELKGYEFFGSGKLEKLKLTVSSKDDVRKIFGENCEVKCSYGADWLISFTYFEDIWIKTGQKGRYLLDSKYLGKLRLIEIQPQKQLSFADVSFSEEFRKSIETSTTHARSGKSRLTINDIFEDSYGLSYEIFLQTSYDDIKNKKAKSYKKGDLVLIRYKIPEKLEEDLFVLQK